jgi:hypothetical protein
MNAGAILAREFEEWECGGEKKSEGAGEWESRGAGELEARHGEMKRRKENEAME